MIDTAKGRRWPSVALIPVAAGLLWFWCAASFGVLGFLFSLVPGCLLLASGVATLLYPGDLRIPQFAALGGALGVPLALPAWFVAGPWIGLALTCASVAGFFAAGAISVLQEPRHDDIPMPVLSLGLAAQVAIDDAILASMAVRLRPVQDEERVRIIREVRDARDLFRDRGWLERPRDYHVTPPALDAPRLRPAGIRSLAYEHLEFQSGYEPRADEPGRERWLSRAANRTAHAWVLRHRGGARPWLVCIHGYEMGSPWIDLMAFEAARFHHRLGFNLALPVLPLHGPRRVGRRSGDGFLAGDFLDTVHAEAQSQWDIRRLISWIRAQGGEAIGAHGLSLGGYNVALLAALEPLDCAIAGIPATDFRRLAWRHGAPLELRAAERSGLVHDEVAEVLRVVSPLALPPLVARDRRYIYAGVADRIVPAELPRDLWLHWERPRIVWYQGGHVTFRRHAEVAQLVMDALRESGLLTGAAPEAGRRGLSGGPSRGSLAGGRARQNDRFLTDV